MKCPPHEEFDILILRLQKRVSNYFAGSHLQRTGDTMAPSFFNSAKALSTSLRSAPNALVTSPAETGLPTSRIACNTFSFIIIDVWLLFKLFDDIIQHAEEAWNGFRSYTFADDGVADGLGDIGQFLLKVTPLLR